jgi:hypothetical protein
MLYVKSYLNRPEIFNFKSVSYPGKHAEMIAYEV